MVAYDVYAKVVDRQSHGFGVFLVNAEDNCLGEAVRLADEVGEVTRDRLGTGFECHFPFEILRPVFRVRDFAPVAVELAFGGTPSGRIRRGYDAVHPVRRQEPIIYPLPQAVCVDRVSEIPIRVFVVLPQWRGCHAKLKCWLEVFEDLTPVAFVACAPTVTLVDDDEIEEIRWVFVEQTRPPLVSSYRLIRREIHLAAHHRLALDLVASVAHGCEGLVLRIIDEDVAIGEKQDARPPVLSSPIPTRTPQHPAYLESD